MIRGTRFPPINEMAAAPAPCARSVSGEWLEAVPRASAAPFHFDSPPGTQKYPPLPGAPGNCFDLYAVLSNRHPLTFGLQNP